MPGAPGVIWPDLSVLQRTSALSQVSWGPQHGDQPAQWLWTPEIQAPVREQDSHLPSVYQNSEALHNICAMQPDCYAIMDPSRFTQLGLNRTFTVLHLISLYREYALLKYTLRDVLASISAPNILKHFPWGRHRAHGSPQTHCHGYKGLCSHLGQGPVELPTLAWLGLVFRYTNGFIYQFSGEAGNDIFKWNVLFSKKRKSLQVKENTCKHKCAIIAWSLKVIARVKQGLQCGDWKRVRSRQ